MSRRHLLAALVGLALALPALALPAPAWAAEWVKVADGTGPAATNPHLTVVGDYVYVIPPGATSPAFYLSAGVANLYPDTSATSTTGGDYISIYACF